MPETFDQAIRDTVTVRAIEFELFALQAWWLTRPGRRSSLCVIIRPGCPDTVACQVDLMSLG